MDQVPKVLKPLVQEWIPEGYIVSFKVDLPLLPRSLLTRAPQLETDMALLIPKSRAALSRYGHQLVIGNDLHGRKYQVVFVEPASPNFTPRRAKPNDEIRGVETPPLTSANGTSPLDHDSMFRETWLRLDEVKRGSGGGANGEVEIEELIIKELVDRHDKWIEASKATSRI